MKGHHRCNQSKLLVTLTSGPTPTLFLTMGNKSSVATIVAHVDQQVITTGSVVTGTVYMDVTQLEVNCTGIHSRLLGQEHTEIHYSERIKDGKKFHSVDRVAKARSIFLDMHFNLASFANNTVPRGQFEFPFSFVIPEGSPASMHACGHSRDRCKIVYTLEFCLERPGIMRYDIRTQRVLVVVNPAPNRARISGVMEPTRMPLYSMWCFRRGEVLLGGSVDSCVLSGGQQATVKYAARNYSKSHIKAIEVTLKEVITIRSHNRRGQVITNTLYHRRITPKDTTLELAPLSGGTSSSAEGLRLLSNMLDSEEHQLDLTVPRTARSSYEGSLINVKHTLTIQLITPFGTANPCVQREIQMHTAAGDTTTEATDNVYAVLAPPQSFTSVPEGWNPVVAVPVAYPAAVLCAPTAPPDDEYGEQCALHNNTYYQALKCSE